MSGFSWSVPMNNSARCSEAAESKEQQPLTFNSAPACSNSTPLWMLPFISVRFSFSLLFIHTFILTHPWLVLKSTHASCLQAGTARGTPLMFSPSTWVFLNSLFTFINMYGCIFHSLLPGQQEVSRCLSAHQMALLLQGENTAVVPSRGKFSSQQGKIWTDFVIFSCFIFGFKKI